MKKILKDTILAKTAKHKATQVPTEGDWAHFVDGIAVNGNTKRFADEVRKILPDVMFGVDETCRQEYRHGGFSMVAACLWVLLPYHPMGVGKIGWGEYIGGGKGQPSKDAFMVYSHKIQNERYASGSDSYHMKLSGGIEAALKNVRAFMRPHDPVDMAKEYSYMLYGAVNGTVQQATLDLKHAGDQIKSSAGLLTELAVLAKSGYKFIDPTFGERVLAWEQMRDRHADTTRKPVQAYFVNVYTVRDQQMFSVVDVCNTDNESFLPQWGTAQSKTYTTDTLPESIMGKLAVLSLLNPDGYSKDVGFRVSETLFWVEK